MKTKKMLGVFAVALTALACALPGTAKAGDIRSIEVYQDTETTAKTYPNMNNPLVAGETVKFKIRLLNRGMTVEKLAADRTYTNPWTIQHVGLNDPLADTNDMPQVGLWISGQRKYAKIESLQLSDRYFTDVICSYKVEPGDLAMPLKLVRPDGFDEAMEVVGSWYSEDYYVKNFDRWSFFPASNEGNTTSNRVEFSFGPTSLQGTGIDQEVVIKDLGSVRDYNLAGAGIYIQAVDFDDQTTDDEEIWRNIAANSTQASPALPRVKIPGGSAYSQKLYVWTADQSVAEVDSAETYVFGDGVTRKVGTINVKPGDEYVSFKIKGITEGGNTEVFMAATPTNVYNAAGTMLTNFTMKTIHVTEALPPGMTVEIEPDVVKTSSDYTMSVAAINVRLTQAWTNAEDLVITLTPTMKDGSGLDAFDYIGLSKLASDKEAHSQKELTLTISRNGDSAAASMLYLYANRADEHTLKGITFAVDQTKLSAAAKNFFTGAFMSDTIEIDYDGGALKVLSPIEGATYAHVPGNVAHNFEITIEDAIGEIESTDGPYTVWWDNNGSGNFVAVDGLNADAKGRLIVPRTYVTAMEYNSQFYVENRGGAKSEVRHVKVSVDAPKTVTGTVDKGLLNYAEGEEAKVSFDFSNNFEESTQPGYIFVIPLDEATSNLVEITSQSEDSHTTDVQIFPGMASAIKPATIRLKDGYKGVTLKFGIEVRDDNDNTKNNIIATWVGKPFFIGVDNVAPSISYIAMGASSTNNTPITVNGGSFKGAVPIGVQETFTIGIKDPALEADFADGDKAYTQIRFWENGSVVDTKLIKGIPAGQSVTHRFMNAGTAQVTAKVRDKDMTDQEFDEAPEFTVNLTVVDAPAITLIRHSGGNIFNENEWGIVNGRIDVELTVPPSGLEVGEVITVEITVTPNGWSGAVPAINKSEITFANGQTSGFFYFQEFDGTPDSEQKGFNVHARIKETGKCPMDMTKTWREYYKEVDNFDIFVQNVDPVIGPGSAPSTNESPAALNVPFKLQWNVSDVAADKGDMSVTWTYNGSSQTDPHVSATGTYEKEIMFTSAGSKVVVLQVKDKDGGTDTRTWYYRVNPSMGLDITPRRPNTGARSKFSQMYTQSVGIGAGRVWSTQVDKPTMVSNFTQSWDFEPGNDLNPRIYAFGYKLDNYDDGTLGPAGSRDYALDESGAWHNDGVYGSHYKYTNADGKDSFFYCWLVFDNDEGNSTHLNGTIQPQVGDGTGENWVQMPEADEEATSYPRTSVEGIFSIERFMEDNVGDINQDGIPDIYAAGTTWDGGLLFEAAGYMLEEGGDLKNLADNNIDEDFLPINGVYNGGTLVVPQNYWNNWSTAGGAFTAYTELRGFHDGLNYRRDHNGLNRNVRGPWISDPVFSEAESNAVARVNGLTIPDATLDPESEEYKAQVAAWKAGLEKDDSWIPENRTDPTMSDTDSDGFPDGYEYFIWYKAMVGEMVNGKVVRLSGSRFTLDDIATGEEITPEEIAEAFNPTVKAAGKWEERDTDNDGLTDMEEYALGTSPINWDTDGDGLSDFWEVINGMNPMKADTANGARMNADGDYMARYTTEPDYMIVKIKGKEYALTGNGGRYVAYDEETQTFVLADSAKEEFVAIPVFRYGKPDSEVVPKNRKDPLAEEVINFELEEDEELTLEEVHEFQPLMLIHDQVYAVFGYDPRTGWYINPNGLLNDRWYLKPEQQAGTPVNTVPFTARDEYLLLKYRYETGMPQYVPETDTVRPFSPDTDRADFWNATQRRYEEVFRLGTTNPNVAWSDPEYVREEMGEVAYANEAHGADTDSNGVPDGWELYVGQNPNTAVLTDAAGQPTGIRETDNDGLGLAAEFAGTDSCAAYAGCESIYANHPGLTRGWWNKFFPTDPSDDDTDGDGLSDGAEGSGWDPDGSGPNGVDMFYYWRYGKAAMNGNVVEYWRYDNARQANPIPNQPLFRFIYGPNNHMPAGDDGSICIRGGGLNPCSVDTDGDLLPDPWEMQFAGLVFSNGNPVWCSLNPASLVTLINRADRMSQGGTTEGEGNDNDAAASGPEYITAGMDGTYAGDAYADPGLVDAVTHTVRDFDFDHDGLQNFQEYLVQAVRHFRYDDSQTPLMGSWMADGTLNSRKFVSFLPMNIMDGETFYQQCREAGFAATAAWDFKRLGYFAPPTKAWDKTALTGSSNYGDEDGEGSCYRIMMPAGTTYASTDPRLWDTDEDGMDDFYELFHGLNPLLGSIQDGTADFDIVARTHWNPMFQQYDVTHWSNAWTGNPATPWPDNGGQPVFDVMAYPWMMGVPEADADGDGLRNSDEALLVNMPSPQPTHTDPTPLWYTDRTSLNDASFTRQYYQTDAFINAQGGIPDLAAYPWPWVDSTYMFNFEENEGYDTDSDHISDLEEKTMTATTIADPLNANDPDRRQAIWFPGNESAAVSYSGELSRPIGEVDTTVYQGPLSRPVGQAYDLLRQFTVEAWINPEDVTRKQVVLERVSEYCASTLSNRVVQIRANFRIGILEDGRIYGCFDTSDAIPSGTGMGTPTVIGTPVEQGKWMHVALTYDGKELKLHQNGRVSGVTQTALIPANGIVSIQQEAVIGMKYFPVLNGGYVTFPIAFVMGARALDGLAIGLTEETTWDSYTDYYAGYVDEVRVWDGARTLEDIQNTYKLRMKTSDVSAQRDEVYVAWMQGATRNDNDGKANLPPELVQHYSFQTLPGAINATDVMWEPSGFTKNVFDNVRDMDGVLPAGTFECGWLSRLPVRSTVYENYTWIPWIQNSCQHLPFYDGFSLDSHYWSEFFGGMTMAREVYNSVNDEPTLEDLLKSGGVKKYVFPNTAQPYNLYFEAVEDLRPFFLETMAIADPSCQTNVNLNLFAQRTRFVGPSDLVPLGGTFAKRCELMWDGDGAADAWELTADGDSAFTDVDANGIPDWWQEYAIANYGAAEGFDWNSMVTRNGLEITAREAYLRDLAEGVLPGGVFNQTYISRRDDDKDGMPDWWESLKGINAENAYGDHDGDQLSNYAEYLISEGFSNYGFPRVDPIKPSTFGQDVTDYFLRVGSLYLGEMFTDHDMIADVWEDKYSVEWTSRGVWDALKDPDDDGWSNWSEYQAGTDPSIEAVLTTDGATLAEYPVPVVEASIRYNGKKSFNAPIVIKAWAQDNTADKSMGGLPDAAWLVPSTTEASEHEKILGLNRGRKLTYCLGPGSVEQSSFELQIKDLGQMTLLINQYGEYRTEYVDPSTVDWQAILYDQPRNDGSGKGDLIGKDSTGMKMGEGCGEIDYNKGIVTIDFGCDLLQGYAARPEDGGNANDDDGDVYQMTVMDISQSYIKLFWRSRKVDGGNGATFYLGDSLGAVANSDDDNAGSTDVNASIQTRIGHLREGRNMFTAFADIDGNGKWTPGEPYGIAANVQVGWSSASFSIELTDTTPQMARMDLAAMTGGTDSGSTGTGTGETAGGDAFTDRSSSVNGYYSRNQTVEEAYKYLEVTGGDDTDGGNTGAGVAAGALDPNDEGMPGPTATTRIRVVRTAVNGDLSFNGVDWNQVVLDREIYLGGHPTLTEADLVADGLLDLDWGTLAQAWKDTHNQSAIMTGLTNVSYRVIYGNGSDTEWDFNSFAPVVFVNCFEYGRTQTLCVPVSPKGTIYGTTGIGTTFEWTHKAVDANGYKIKDYPAFRLQVLDESNAVVFDSGDLPAPARNSLGVYSWKAPLYAGMVTQNGKVFDTKQNYKWQVSMLDAKFTTPAWNTPQAFRLEATGMLNDGRRYGTIAANVRYFGPLVNNVSTSKANLKNIIRVQAFTTPDFAGQPVGEGMVTNTSMLASTSLEAINAVTFAVPTLEKAYEPGKFYLCAFIDTNGNGIRDSWESWGYACNIGNGKENVYAPKAVEITEPSTKVPSVDIFIEDCDTDNDGFPDAWEMQTFGSLDTQSSVKGDTFYTKVNPTLIYKSALSSFSDLGLTELSSGSAYVFPKLMSILLGGDDMATLLINGIALEDATAELSVNIDAFTPESMGVTVSAKAPTMQGATLMAAQPADGLTFDLVLLSKKDLRDDWTETPVKPVKVPLNSKIDIDDAAIGAKIKELKDHTFFKVKLVPAR